MSKKDIETIINEYLNIKESYQLPEKMLACLMNPVKKVEMFNLVLEHYPSLESDIFFEYFESEHANKGKLKQDFTPPEICEIVAQLSKKVETIKDMCAGTGGLSIKQINKNPNAYYIFEEISERTLPLLLFNLAIRNINGIIKLGDSLTMQYERIYKLEKGDKYSNINISDDHQDEKVDLVITNPPYSLKWEHPKGEDERFEFGLAPKSKADYAFIQHGLSKLNENGEMYCILPHGVLFRGASEGKIRQKLLEENLIDMIIGLPSNMFQNTAIPTLILKLKKNRKNKDIYIIDASKECIKEGKYNLMQEKNIDTVVGAANIRRPIELLADCTDFEELKKNEFNLNIPRYVDTHIPEPVPDLLENMKEYFEICREIETLENELFSQFAELVDSTPEGQKELDGVMDLWQERKEEKCEQLRISV